MSDIQKRVIKVVAEHLTTLDASDIKADSSFIDDLGADSLDIVELVMGLEEEFNIEIPDEAAEKIITIKDACDYIADNLSNPNTPPNS